MNEKPLYLIRWWLRVKGQPRPELKHTVAYSEEVLLSSLKNVIGNYTVYTIGGEYLPKSHFDAIFQKEKEDKEREEFNKLKAKYGTE